jgi:hypothetical protein
VIYVQWLISKSLLEQLVSEIIDTGQTMPAVHDTSEGLKTGFDFFIDCSRVSKVGNCFHKSWILQNFDGFD